jgi:AcrR family transcriptional regulator
MSIKKGKHEKEENLDQQILEAAEELFLEKGFAMTSTTEIARKVGCNQALVHYYFRTKENLFQSIFEKKFRLLISTFQEKNSQGMTFEEKLRSKIEYHFEMVRANPRLPFLVFNELLTNPNRINAIKSRVYEVPQPVFSEMQRELQEEIAKGTIRPLTMMDLFFTMVALNVTLFLASPIYRTVLQLSDAEYEQFIEHRKAEHVRIILSSLKP